MGNEDFSLAMGLVTLPRREREDLFLLTIRMQANDAAVTIINSGAVDADLATRGLYQAIGSMNSGIIDALLEVPGVNVNWRNYEDGGHTAFTRAATRGSAITMLSLMECPGLNRRAEYNTDPVYQFVHESMDLRPGATRRHVAELIVSDRAFDKQAFRAAVNRMHEAGEDVTIVKTPAITVLDQEGATGSGQRVQETLKRIRLELRI